jgi:nitrogenase molybdenum-iron protein alpha chain
MNIFKDLPEVEVRERRLNSIVTYNGTGKDLYDKVQSKFKFTCGDRSFDQCASCPESCAHTQAANNSRGTASVFHAPVGCDANIFENILYIKSAGIARNITQCKVNTIISNIQEKDTIFGAAEKLKQAIREADRRFHPTAIYVTTSCASGIIGEDIESIADEMEEELGYPIVRVYCEGFKSKVWASGFDAIFHGILRKLIKPPRKKQNDLVNIIAFAGSDVFSPLLSQMGLRVNFFLGLASIEQIESMSEAACTTSICETLSMYAASVLEEQYGVTEIKTAAPYGIDWTDIWLRAIGKVTGREEEAEKIILSEKEKIKNKLEELREKLSGKRLYVLAGDAYAGNIANIGISLGMEIAGVTAYHHDSYLDNPGSKNSIDVLVETSGDIPELTICNFQPYQVVKILKRLKPDIVVVRHQGLSPLSSKLGIPTLLLGDESRVATYSGVIKMGISLLDTLAIKKFYENIARHTELPYTDWWLNEEDPFYFEEKEKR